MEIEKKFKIKKLPDNLEQYEQKHIVPDCQDKKK